MNIDVREEGATLATGAEIFVFMGSGFHRDDAGAAREGVEADRT